MCCWSPSLTNIVPMITCMLCSPPPLSFCMKEFLWYTYQTTYLEERSRWQAETIRTRLFYQRKSVCMISCQCSMKLQVSKDSCLRLRLSFILNEVSLVLADSHRSQGSKDPCYHNVPGSWTCTRGRVNQPGIRIPDCLGCTWARTHRHQCKGTPSRCCSWRSRQDSELDLPSPGHRFQILVKQINTFYVIPVDLKLLNQVITKPLLLKILRTGIA